VPAGHFEIHGGRRVGAGCGGGNPHGKGEGEPEEERESIRCDEVAVAGREGSISHGKECANRRGTISKNIIPF
jgi:hypothetical protein